MTGDDRGLWLDLARRFMQGRRTKLPAGLSEAELWFGYGHKTNQSEDRPSHDESMATGNDGVKNEA